MTFRPYALALCLAALLAPARAAGQQFVTDDAAITELRACQLEAWHGGVASWVLPACHFVPNLEVTAGVGWVDDDSGSRGTEFVVQGKYLLRALTPNGAGIGVVAGFGVDPLGQTTGDRLAGLFAYVPVSLSVAGDRLMLHGNLGWQFEGDHHDHDHGDHHGDHGGHHALTWAARADLLLPVPGERLTLIGELFGENRLLPEFQVGLRTTLVPDRLLADVSWAGHTQRDLRGAGWVVGVAWTPPPFR